MIILEGLKIGPPNEGGCNDELFVLGVFMKSYCCYLHGWQTEVAS